MPPVRPIAPAPTTETLGQVCVDFARSPCTSLVQKRHHHSPARVSPIELRACGPVIEEQATAAFQQRTSALQLQWQGRHGNLVPSGAVRWRSQVCGGQKRRDAETSPRAPCVVPSLQMVPIRQSGLFVMDTLSLFSPLFSQRSSLLSSLLISEGASVCMCVEGCVTPAICAVKTPVSFRHWRFYSTDRCVLNV